MDRLSTLTNYGGGWAIAMMISACGAQDSGASPPARSRVAAVPADPAEPVNLDGFCERRYSAEQAPILKWPALREGGQVAEATAGHPRWINVWATWCKPCIEELPRLRRWADALAPRLGVELVFLSADGDPAAVQGFMAEHPEVKSTLELREASGLSPWAKELGLPGSVVLPVHVFVDAKDRVRCLRSAGVGEGDKAAVEQLFSTM